MHGTWETSQKTVGCDNINNHDCQQLVVIMYYLLMTFAVFPDNGYPVAKMQTHRSVTENMQFVHSSELQKYFLNVKLRFEFSPENICRKQGIFTPLWKKIYTLHKQE